MKRRADKTRIAEFVDSRMTICLSFPSAGGIPVSGGTLKTVRSIGRTPWGYLLPALAQ